MAVADREAESLAQGECGTPDGERFFSKVLRRSHSKKRINDQGREGTRSKTMIKSDQIRSGGYGGPVEFDKVLLAPVRRETSDLLAGRIAFLEKLDELKPKYGGLWVAFHGATFLGAAESEPELISQFNSDGALTGHLFTDFVFGD